MSISFDPYGRTSMSASADRLATIQISDSISHVGIADRKSSLESYGSLQLGFCDCFFEKLVEIWRSILACFSFGTVNTSTSVVSSIAPLEMRIQKAATALDRRLSEIRLEEANPARTVIVFVLKYNNEAVVHFRKLQNGESESIADFSKRYLNALLSKDSNRDCHDGKLEIEVLLFEKNANSRFNYRYADSFVQFPGGNHSGEGSGSSANIGHRIVFNHLAIAIPREADRRQIFDFLINRL